MPKNINNVDGTSEGGTMRKAAAASILCLAFLAAGCASTEHTGSNTPRFTVDPTEDSSLLVSEGEARVIDGLDGVVAVELNDLGLYENPDLRGPCGGAAPALPVRGAIGRAFTAPSVQVVEIVVPTDSKDDDFLAAMLADQHDDCGPYDSMTNVGTKQTVSEISFVDLNDLGLPSIAWTNFIESGSNSGFSGVMMFQSDTYQVFFQMQSTSPVRPSTLQALAVSAAGHLANET